MAGAAWAQPSVRAITSVSAGGSDNARGLADPSQKRSVNAFGRAAAGLDLGYRAEGANHLLRLAVGTTGYANSSGLTNFAQEASLVSQWAGERVTFEFGAAAARSQLDDLSPLLDSGLSPADLPTPVTPPFTDHVRVDEEIVATGTIGYAGGTAAESFAVELSPRWNFYQSGGLNMFSAIQDGNPDPPIWSVATDVGIERSFVRDAARLELTAGREVQPTLRYPEAVIPAETGDFGRAGLAWVHQLTPKWRTDLSGGAYVARAAQAHPWQYGPAWRGALHWRGQFFRVSGMYDRSVQPSVVLGGIFLADRASIRTVARLGPEEQFRFRAIMRYQRMSAVGPVSPLPPPMSIDPSIMGPPMPPPEPPSPPSEELTNTVANRWQAQLTLGWAPWHNRLVELGLTYRLTNQVGATLGRRRLRTLERNLVLLTLTVGVPLRPDPE